MTFDPVFIRDILVVIFALLGTFFVFIASLGLIRMPDILMRLQTVSKASTLGAAFSLLAVAIFFQQIEITVRAIFVIIFLFLTSPVAAHVIARSAYKSKIALWDKTICDEMKDADDHEFKK